MKEYLFEIRSQEMPRESAPAALKQLGGRLFEELMGRGLGPAEILTGWTPRRLVLCCRGLPEHEPEREDRQLGPPLAEAYDEAGEPTSSLLGFAERVESAIEDLEEIQTERGIYLGIVHTVAGRPVSDLLREALPRFLAEVRWPARDRFPGLAWVRPVESILSLLDGEVLPFEFGGVQASRLTQRHPIHAPEAVAIDDYEHYLATLAEVGVEPRWAERRQRLEEAFEEEASKHGGQISMGDTLDRLAAGCGIPGVISGSFGGEFLALPEEVVESLLARRQGALVVRSKGTLLPFFVAPMDRLDDPEGKVRAGFERAVAGRLADIRHHFERDRQTTLAERSRDLDQLPFHEALGHLGEKTERVRALVSLIANALEWGGDGEAAEQAAMLAKADLTCEMVRESPALRGTLGGILAREEGYVEAVWRAIAHQYRPGSVDGALPTTRSGQLLALADRLDTLVGFCALGELPRGGKDPLALRRLTLGLLRLLVELDLELDLDLVAARAALAYGDRVAVEPEDLLASLQGFLDERIRHFFGQRGYAFDEIEAAMAVGWTSLVDLERRLRALQEVREDVEFRSLVLAAKRIANMVAEMAEHELDPELLGEDAERELADVVATAKIEVDAAITERRYEEGLRAMGALVPVLDRFFAEVLVMDENEALRNNRVALLQVCRRLFWRIARIKQMVVDSPDRQGDPEAEVAPSPIQRS